VAGSRYRKGEVKCDKTEGGMELVLKKGDATKGLERKRDKKNKIEVRRRRGNEAGLLNRER